MRDEWDRFSWTEWLIDGVERKFFTLRQVSIVSGFYPGRTVRKRRVTEWHDGRRLVGPLEQERSIEVYPDIPLAKTPAGR
jgi:hypothetical protein